MVNVYGNFGENGYNNPYASNNPAPAATAREATAIAGAQVGFRGSYGGTEGQAATDYRNILAQQEQARADAAAAEARTRQMEAAATTVQQQNQARNIFLNRADMVRTSDLGDSRTQSLIGQGYTAEQALSIQKQEALLTPTLQDDRYYENEYQKALQTNISLSGGYHAWARGTGLPQAVNPYENVADMSLVAIKDTQNNAFNNAVHGTNVQPDVTGQANVIAQAKYTGDLGAYGKLASTSGGRIVPLAEQQQIATKAAKGAGWVVRPELQSQDPSKSPEAAEYWNRGKGMLVRANNQPTRVVVVPQQNPQLVNFNDYLNGRRDAYDKRVQSYEQAGATDANEYSALEKERQSLLQLGNIEMMVGIGNQQNRVDNQPKRPFVSVAAPTDTKTFEPNPVYATLSVMGNIPFLNPFATTAKLFISPGTTSETVYNKTPTVTNTPEGATITFAGMTTVTPAKSAYEQAEDAVSTKIQSFLPAGTMANLALNEEIQWSLAGIRSPNPMNPLQNVASAVVATEMKSAVEKPLMAATSYGVGFVGGAVFKGVESVGLRVAPKVAAISPRAAKVGATVWKVAPYAMGAVYTGDVAYRSTSGFTNFEPTSVARKAIPIVTFEGIPMTVGFIHGYKAPDAVLGKKVDVGYYPVDNTRVASGGMFEQGRPQIDPTELASGGQFRSIPNPNGVKFIKTGEIREGGVFGQGGLYPRARGQVRNIINNPMNDVASLSIRGGGEDGSMSFGGVSRRTGVKAIDDAMGYRTDQYGFPVGEKAIPKRMEFDAYPSVDFGSMFPTRPLAPERPIAPERPMSVPSFKPTTVSPTIDARFGIIPKNYVAIPKTVTRPISVASAHPFALAYPQDEMAAISRTASTPSIYARAGVMALPATRMDAITKSAARSDVMSVSKPRLRTMTTPFVVPTAKTTGLTTPMARGTAIATPKGLTISAPRDLATPISDAMARARVRTATRPITDGIAMPRPVTTTSVVPFSIPSFGSVSGGGGYAMGSYFTGFREKAPTWTPAQMGRALFTGSFNPKSKPKKRTVRTVYGKQSGSFQTHSGTVRVIPLKGAPKRTRGRKK